MPWRDLLPTGPYFAQSRARRPHGMTTWAASIHVRATFRNDLCAIDLKIPLRHFKWHRWRRLPPVWADPPFGLGAIPPLPLGRPTRPAPRDPSLVCLFATLCLTAGRSQSRLGIAAFSHTLSRIARGSLPASGAVGARSRSLEVAVHASPLSSRTGQAETTRGKFCRSISDQRSAQHALESHRMRKRP